MIDLDAVAANYRMLAAKNSPAETGAAVKADAYGLGMDTIAPLLWVEGCRVFFVASFGEGVALRSVLPEAEIYALNGLVSQNAREFVEARIKPVLNDPGQLALWSDYCRENGPQGCILHLDTGINRLGLAETETLALAEDQTPLKPVALDYVMSHLACGDTPDHPMNAAQLKDFNRLRHLLPSAPASIANTAGILMGPEYDLHLGRPGIGIYGGNPFTDRPNPMAQAIELKARILQVREIGAGATVGYGATWRSPGTRRIATVEAGYADGYFRNFDNCGFGFVGDIRVPVCGRVSMDLVTLDVTEAPEAETRPGNAITLLGGPIDLDELTAAAGVGIYQLLSLLGARYERRYVHGGEDVA